VVQLHADGAQNGANRTGGTALFADDLAYILRGNPKLEHRVLLAVHGLDFDGLRSVYKGLGDLPDQLGDGRWCNHIVLGHALAPDLMRFEMAN
jgi:hypothetical protein